jgi:hypothetical protein
MKTEFIETSETSGSRQADQIKATRPSNLLPERMRSRAKDLFTKRFMCWMCPERRIGNRYPAPPLIAYLGTVRSSQEYRIGDVSVTGFYMVTEDRWVPGTVVPVTLERTDQEDARISLTVNATVVRNGSDGVGFSFVQDAVEGHVNGEIEAGSLVNLTKLAQFLTGLPLAAANPLQSQCAS